MPTSDQRSQENRINDIENALGLLGSMPDPPEETETFMKASQEYADHYVNRLSQEAPDASEMKAFRRQVAIAPIESAQRAAKLLVYAEATNEMKEKSDYKHVSKVARRARAKGNEIDNRLYQKYAVAAAAYKGEVPGPETDPALYERNRIIHIENQFESVIDASFDAEYGTKGERVQGAQRAAQALTRAGVALPPSQSGKRLKSLAERVARRHPEAAARAQQLGVLREAADKMIVQLGMNKTNQGPSTDSSSVEKASETAEKALAESSKIGELKTSQDVTQVVGTSPAMETQKGIDAGQPAGNGRGLR